MLVPKPDRGDATARKGQEYLRLERGEALRPEPCDGSLFLLSGGSFVFWRIAAGGDAVSPQALVERGG